MPSLKSIRKRIVSVKSTQKITRAMKMVAGARLNKAQQRITELRAYAVKTREVLFEVTAEGRRHLAHGAAEEVGASGDASERAQPRQPGAEPDTALDSTSGRGHAANGGGLYGETSAFGRAEKPVHPLLAVSPERHVLLVVLTSDRGLCGSFNTSVAKLAESEWRRRTAEGQTVTIFAIGRKGRDYFRRRRAPMVYLDGAWSDLSWEGARKLGRTILAPYLQTGPKKGEDGTETLPVDAIYLVYNEFKSAMSQQVVAERLLPVGDEGDQEADGADGGESTATSFLFEPSEEALLDQLAPMYLQVSLLRALYESMASELGARMTAMDAATSNAADMIGRLTLVYNRARQAAITKELMEIIGGSEALKG